MPPAQQDALGMWPAWANMPDRFEPSFANKVPMGTLCALLVATCQHVHRRCHCSSVLLLSLERHPAVDLVCRQVLSHCRHRLCIVILSSPGNVEQQ